MKKLLKSSITPSRSSTRPLRILFAGDASSGKTSLISVLINGILDDGIGSARKTLLQHPHEREDGHTTQVISYVLRYSEGKSEKYVHLFDGCGLQNHLKTMTHGFTSIAPDYVFLLVDGKVGITATTKEHMGIALVLGKPISVIITKIDKCEEEQLKTTLGLVEDLLRNAAGKTPTYSVPMHPNSALILSVSVVTGENLSRLHEILKSLYPKSLETVSKSPSEVWIRKVYEIPEVGIVLEGLLNVGTIHKGQYLRLGPIDGEFRMVIIKSIITCRGEEDIAEYGQDIAVKIASADGKELEAEILKKTKGLMLVTKIDKNGQSKMFDAEIAVVKKAFIKIGRVVTVHTGNLSQAAEVDDLAGEEVLKQGDKGLIRCKFKEPVSFLKTSEKVIFRSGSVLAVGIITKIY